MGVNPAIATSTLFDLFLAEAAWAFAHLEAGGRAGCLEPGRLKGVLVGRLRILLDI